MPELSDPHPHALATPDEKGKAPKNRLKNVWQAWECCKEMDDGDRKRRKKRERIYKAYNRFPPSDYSTLFSKGQDWQSNVNHGMLAYVVDNNLSSFFDMVTERTSAAEIRTKKGTEAERNDWSDHISAAYDKVLREWDDFLLNVEQHLLDMLLYGKGLEIWEDVEGCATMHISADDFLVPPGTKVSFANFDVCAIKRRYSLHELWEKVENASSSDRGWNRKAVLRAMRAQRKAWSEKYKDDNEWTKAIAEGDVMLAGHLKEHLDCYILFIKEFKSKKISKYVILQDYAPIVSLTRDKDVTARLSKEDRENSDREVIKEEGFLFSKTDYADDIKDIFNVFMDCAGSGMWHRIPSLAEKVFVQCRQYDFTMNAIMDAVKVNMSLMLQASTAEASEKIKSLVWGPYTIIPSDVPFVQQRFQLPTGEATQALQFMMLDMFRGIGEYRVHEKGAGGEAPTATQTQLDAAEAAKLSGTQLKRYNGQHTIFYRKHYKRLVELKRGEKDYEQLEKFKDYLKERGVPDAAWKWENIESITSNMLAGAGSPSYKLMAAKETIALTNVSPNGEGQAKAVEDAIASLHGRTNVARYVKKARPDKTFSERMAGYENLLLGNIFTNPADIQVQPDDDDVYHLETHFTDMERTITLVNERMKQGNITEFYAESASFKLLNLGGHSLAHIKKLAKDQGKRPMVAIASKRLNSIQKMADKLSKDLEALKGQKQAEFDPAKDPDIQKKLAMSQLEVTTAEKMAAISLGAIATKHKQRLDMDQDRTANAIALDRAKAATKIETEKKARKSSGPPRQ